jgi:class 3 adenylate cyclase
MFSDIRGFTSLRRHDRHELVRPLNEYLGEMTEVIFKNLGTLDKYIGDAIMAFWGSPYPQNDHALRACHCALEMIHGLEKLNAKWVGEGRKEIAIGIGLNTGPVNVGNMGSAKRLAWTVMGDNVNLASRLEGMTKQYRSHIVISGAQAGCGSVCLPRTGPDTGERQASTGRSLRIDGHRSRQAEIRGADYPLRERHAGISRAGLARRGRPLW